MPNNDNEPFIKMDDFNGGVVDAFGQGKEPENSFSDSQNFVPFLKKSLLTVHGYSSVGGLTNFPHNFPLPSGAGLYNAANIVSEIYPFSSQNPSPYDGRVYFFKDNQGSPVNHVMLDTWFRGSTTPEVGNGGFIPLDDRKIIPAGGDVSFGSGTLIVANANTTYGLSTANDFYGSRTNNKPPWIIDWNNGGVHKYATVIAYAYSAGTATFSTMESIGSWSNTGTFTIWRWFHSLVVGETTFTGPDFGTQPGQCFQGSGRVRGCGGPTSNPNYIPWISQYINRTFFTGLTANLPYQGTYVDEMRCRAPSSGSLVAFASAPGGVTVLPIGAYNLWCSFEYDGYEEGEITFCSGVSVDGSTEVVLYDLICSLWLMSKRITAINVYVSQIDSVTGFQTDPYFLKRYDIVTPTADQLDTTYGWQFPGSVFHELDHTRGTVTNAQYQLLIDGDAWTNRGGSYFSRTGRNSEYPALSQDIVSWQYTKNVSGRQFFANYYDPNTSKVYANAMRFTGFDVDSNATPDVIPNDPLFNQTNVSPDTGSEIRGMEDQNGWLYVFMNPGIYGFSITAYPEQWVKYPVSTIDGLYSIKSLGKMPEGGGIFFADVDHFKLMHNQKITPLTLTIPNLYYNLSGKSQIRAWYDKIDRAICFSNGVSGQHYRGYPELVYPLEGSYRAGNLVPAFPWYPCKYSDNIEFVTMLRDASILFTNQTSPMVFQVHFADQTFDGNGIIPYLKTNSKFMDDEDAVSKGLIDKVHIHFYDTGTIGQFDCKITIDGNVYTWTQVDKTKGHLFLKLPATTPRYGRHMFFEINTFPPGMYDNLGDIQLTEIVFYGQHIRFFPKNET